MMNISEQIDIFPVSVYLEAAKWIFEQIERMNTTLEETYIGFGVKGCYVTPISVFITPLKHNFSINNNQAWL